MIYHSENTFYNQNFSQEYEIYENSINISNTYIILCQGFSLSLRYWKKDFIMQLLYNLDIQGIILFNYRGFRSKTKPKNEDLGTNELSVKMLAKDLYQFIQYLETKISLKKFCLIGHSMGSFIVQQFISDFFSPKLSHIIFIVGGCLCNFDLHMTKEKMEFFLRNRESFSSKQFDCTISTVMSYLSAIYQARVDENCCQSFENYKIPFLYLQSGNESIITFTQNDDCILSSWQKKYLEHVIVSETSHNMVEENSNRILQEIIKFFK